MPCGVSALRKEGTGLQSTPVHLHISIALYKFTFYLNWGRVSVSLLIRYIRLEDPDSKQRAHPEIFVWSRSRLPRKLFILLIDTVIIYHSVDHLDTATFVLWPKAPDSDTGLLSYVPGKSSFYLEPWARRYVSTLCINQEIPVFTNAKENLNEARLPQVQIFLSFKYRKRIHKSCFSPSPRPERYRWWKWRAHQLRVLIYQVMRSCDSKCERVAHVWVFHMDVR